MSGLTVAGQQLVLEHMMGKTAMTLQTPFIGLTTTAPTDTTAGTEAAYTGYARKATAAVDWTNASATVPSVMSNATVQTFAQCTAGTATVTFFETWTAPTGGTRIAWGALTASLAISAGISPSFAVGQIAVSMD